MGVLFNEVDDYYTVPESTDLVLPSSGAWCLGIWTNVADLSGDYLQFAFSQGTFGPNSLHLFVGEASSGFAGKWFAYISDIFGQGIQLSGALYGADSVNRLFIVQDVGGPSNAKQLWSCPAGGVAVLEARTTYGLNQVDASGDLNIGRAADGNARYYYGNTLGEFFKGNFTLSEGEIEALAAGQSILDIGKSPDIYLPMVSAAPAITDSSGNGNDATRHGDPETVTPHFITPASGGNNIAAKAMYLAARRRR